MNKEMDKDWLDRQVGTFAEWVLSEDDEATLRNLWAGFINIWRMPLIPIWIFREVVIKPHQVY